MSQAASSPVRFSAYRKEVAPLFNPRWGVDRCLSPSCWCQKPKLIPVVGCYEIRGQNISDLRRTKTMFGARLLAWRWNRLERKAERRGWRVVVEGDE